jgi:hypothetical protein
MSARFILTIVGLAGWCAASLVAFVLVVHTGFVGVAVIGLVIAYCATQFDLDAKTPVGGFGTASLLAAQRRADEQLRGDQRMAEAHAQSLASRSARFFKHFGLGLIVIGVAGTAYRYL